MLSRALAVDGGSSEERLENDRDMWGLGGCRGDGGAELRRGLARTGLGVGSNVSLRGEAVGSSNSNAIPDDVEPAAGECGTTDIAGGACEASTVAEEWLVAAVLIIGGRLFLPCGSVGDGSELLDEDGDDREADCSNPPSRG